MFIKKINSSFLLIFVCAIISEHAVYSHMHPTALPRNMAMKNNPKNNPEFQADWNAVAREALAKALKAQKLNTNVAKNVILFLGDGMGISTVTAGRIYAGQLKGQVGESYQLSFDKFPHVALSKTYNVDHQVPDSAGTATAYLCGEKANLGVIGVNQKVLRGNCSTMSEENNIDSILRWSLREGKRAGIVTTTRITHATPSAAYAHAPDRDFEVDAFVPEDHRDNPMCEDIASQLITKNSDINVVLGGGRRFFMPSTMQDYENPEKLGSRQDGRNLIEEWESKMAELERSHAFVWNKEDFDNIDINSTDYILGLFEWDHMKYGLERHQDIAGEPTLAELTTVAIRNLQRSEKGYFLLVEGGKIDHGHHDNWAKAALTELAEFDEAIQTAVDLTSEEDTLIVVTADHSHVFTIGGYPSRNNSIIDFVDPIGLEHSPPRDGFPYVTVMYANGHTGAFGRTNLTGVDATADNFRQPSHVPLGSESHGGEDVAIFATGPMSHLFHGVQEQNYIAHAMAYASCVGQNKDHCTTESLVTTDAPGSSVTTDATGPFGATNATGLFVTTDSTGSLVATNSTVTSTTDNSNESIFTTDSAIICTCPPVVSLATSARPLNSLNSAVLLVLLSLSSLIMTC